MIDKKIKALILGAGFGTRLRPITNEIPKPLIPIVGVPLIEIILHQLSRTPVEAVFINTHYKSNILIDAICSFSKTFNTKIIISDETKKIMGTAGAIGKIKGQLEGAHLLVINSDILTNYDLIKLIKQHFESPSCVTMGLLSPPFPSKTSIWCKKNSHQITSIGKSSSCGQTGPFSYSGIQLISNQFIQENFTDQPSELIPKYKKLLNSRCISGHTQKAFWHDIGDPESLVNAERYFTKQILEQKQTHLSQAYHLAAKTRGKV